MNNISTRMPKKSSTENDTFFKKKEPQDRKSTPTILKHISLGLFLAGTAAGAIADDQPITLKISHFLPATHMIWAEGGQKFVDEVQAKTKGRVNFEVYPSGQLGGNYLSTLKSGIADIVMLAPSYQPDKLPLTSVAELPGILANSCEGTARLAAIGQIGGILYEQEYKPQKFRMLYANVLPQYKVITTTKTVGTLEDLAGLKIRANGVAMDKTIRALGAVPIKVTASELYDSFTRGTIDGGLYPYGGVKPFKLEQVIQHSVEGANLGTGVTLMAINDKAWNALPADIQDAFNDAAKATEAHLCDYQDRFETESRDQLVKENNLEVVKLTQEETDRWHEQVKAVLSSWSEELDSAGREGSAVLTAFLEADIAQ